MFTFVILSFNRDDIINKSIDAVLYIGSELNLDYEVIVVDNFSTDNTRTLLKQYDSNPNVNIVLSDSNLGVAKGRNLGLSMSKGDFTFVLDDDSIISIDTVKEVELFLPTPNVGIFALNVKNMVTERSFSEDLIANNAISNFHGAGHVINRNVIDEVGLLDENCTFGGEELDYSVRCRDAGYEVLLLNNAEVKHYCKIRGGNEGIDRRSKWIFNYIRVIYKHFPISRAVKLSTYYLVTHLYNLKFNKNLSYFNGAVILIKSFFKGAILGRKSYQKKQAKTLEFYSNKKLRPHFGNYSMLDKLLRR
ncbi:glycosyltransferase family 2 protein [Vibrio parahaemolyticus]